MRTEEQLLDDFLVLKCQGGDSESFDLLARRWHRRLLARARYLTGHDDGAIDATQEAWLAIVRGLPGLADPARFPAWALRIVANKSRDWVRRRQRRRRLDEEHRNEPTAPPPTLPDGDDGNDAVERLGRALAALPEARRAIVAMFYRDGLTVREIAHALAIPDGTVKSRLFHARKQLRSHLEETT